MASPLPSAGPGPDMPPIDALFLIDFDVKKGYTIAWKRTTPGLDLDDRVEYKSLPSGLHTVPDDLIYFVHDGAHAGLSAFANAPCAEEESRNARMIAVGILVPLSYGRLGRAWMHAPRLKSLAARLAVDRTDTHALQEYWDEATTTSNTTSTSTESVDAKGDAPASPTVTFSEPPRPASSATTQHTRKRSSSDGAALSLAPAEYTLAPYHPAWSLTRLLDKFGPLVFPIHRAALLRQRILISCHAPVHEICDFGTFPQPPPPAAAS